MAEPSGQEVLMLELLNRARLDPAGEASRYGIDLNEGLAPGTISSSSKQPLAWSDALFAAADGHSQSMIDFDFFSHTNPNTGSTPQTRANAAGYSGQVAENIAQRGVSPGPINPTSAIFQQHQDLFVDSGIAGRGHRLNILAPTYQEVGVGQTVGDYQGFSTSMVTQDFGVPAAALKFVTGVAYTDVDDDDFYSVGEGVAGLNVAIGATSATSQTAGNYSLSATATGVQTITLTGGGLASAVTFTTALSHGQNIKLDVVDGHTLHTSASGTISGPIIIVEGLGVSGLALTTSSGSQTLFGTKGNDALNGGTGNDTMSGGIGNDSYFVDNPGDQVLESPNAGSDQINTSVSFTLPANVEAVILIAGSGPINAAGNSADNALIGNSSNNALDGLGGNDYMVGGIGDDIYVVDSSSDEVVENPGEGGDIVYASIDYTIGANVESLVLVEGAGALNGAGSSTDNALIGNSSINTLDGRGGNDYMVGGAGNDVYVVDTAGDAVVENPGEGGDIVYASIGYTIGANVESLVLIEGAGAINGAGSSADNALIGNSSNNTLDGRGGNDYMVGGAGDDVYVVDTAGDAVVENPGEGGDIVYASQDYTIGANVESLVLVEGAGNINGSGSNVANAVIGNSGINVLDGKGANDFLVGNGGNDTFVFAAGEASGDLLSDFSGNGAAAGDSFRFVGFGTAAGGATFTQIGATNNWQIHSALDGHNEIITLQNGASVHSSDFIFI